MLIFISKKQGEIYQQKDVDKKRQYKYNADMLKIIVNKEVNNKVLADLRKKSGMSQEELGIKIGVSRYTISYWEIGKRSPSLHEAQKIAEVLNCSLDDLVNPTLPPTAAGEPTGQKSRSE